jgi:magnesium chelatase family protein
MLVRVRSAAVLGVTAIPVDVEVDASDGMPRTFIVGLPGSAVHEAEFRVAAAIRNLAVKVPSKRITV